MTLEWAWTFIGFLAVATTLVLAVCLLLSFRRPPPPRDPEPTVPAAPLVPDHVPDWMVKP